MVLSPVKAGIIDNGFPTDCVIHRFVGTRPSALIVSRPDTVTLLGCSSLRLFDKSPRIGRCSGLNPRRIRASEPCPTPGLAAGSIITRSQIVFKIHRGKVIHSLAALRCRGPLRSAMNNFGNGIRANALGSSPPRCGPQANGLLHRAPLEPSTDLACEMMSRAFSARAQLGCDGSQGVALGWYESGLWPGRYRSEQFKVSRAFLSATLIPFSAKMNNIDNPRHPTRRP